jgi:hypothetical protein
MMSLYKALQNTTKTDVAREIQSAELTCCWCSKRDIRAAVVWSARSTEPMDKENTADLMEYQCMDCGLSFWC